MTPAEIGSERRLGAGAVLRFLGRWLIPVASISAMIALVYAANRLATGDGPHLIGVEMRLAQLLADFDIVRALRLFSTLIAPQPPAGYLPGVFVSLVLGANRLSPLVTMAIPLLLIWDGFRRLNNDRLPWAGWLVLVASPITWLYVEEHGRDLVAASVAVQCVSWLFASQGFTDRRSSTLFGVWLGVGFLTKYTFPMFLVLPCVVSAVHLRSRLRWKNLGFAVAAFLMVAAPWYASYAERVAGYVMPTDAAMQTSQAMNRGGRDHGLTAEMFLLYPLAVKDALGWPGVALLGLGAALAPLRGSLPLAGALGGIALLSPLQQAQDRYVLPAFVLLAALAAPLGRSRWGSALLLAIVSPQLVATVRTFSPGAPAANTANFDHPRTSAGELSWPASRSYHPVNFDVSAWKVDEAIVGIARLQGRPTGTVGLLLPRTPVGPDFGIFLSRSTALGNRWDFANVNLGAQHGGLTDPFFMGPLRDGAWPTTSFKALYAVITPGDGDATAWVQAHPELTEVARLALPNDAAGILYQVGH